jgi:hypothetical protein
MKKKVKNGNGGNQQQELGWDRSDTFCLLGQKSKDGVNNQKNTDQKIV